MQTHVLITGATGFLGSALARRLVAECWPLRVAVRRPQTQWPAGVDVALVPSLEPDSDWHKAVQGITVVVHCAARVHVMRDDALDPLDEFRRINVLGTLKLARQAAEAGVKRFILISSVGVNGAETFVQAFRADDPASPHSAYTLSKWEAEQELMRLARETGMEVVVIRPPLIYGPGAPGNFAQLLRAVNLCLPLPFGRVQNVRSFVALENVVDLIVRCIDHPKAANQIFLVSDGEDLSTADFIRRIAIARGKFSALVPIPESWLWMLARVLRKEQQLRKITCSLQVDIEKTVSVLSWHPIISLDDALVKSVRSSK